MSAPVRINRPDLHTLLDLFPPPDVVDPEIVPAGEVPPPYHDLLVHRHHMTVTVERYHGDLVDVRILARRLTGDSYARKILLTLRQTGRVVQFGIARVNFRYCSEPVRREIVAGRTPLGRILIERNVLRRVEPTAYLRLTPGPAMMGWFDLADPVPVYGRLGIIHCDERPAVEVLEIVAP
jgi:hypothetical protein